MNTEYEVLLLLDPDLDEDRQNEIVTRTRETIERGGGSWDRHDVWGRRKLDESRSVADERDEFEGAEVPVDQAEPDVDERRREAHERGRSVLEDMRGSPEQ